MSLLLLHLSSAHDVVFVFCAEHRECLFSLFNCLNARGVVEVCAFPTRLDTPEDGLFQATSITFNCGLLHSKVILLLSKLLMIDLSFGWAVYKPDHSLILSASLTAFTVVKSSS